MPNPESEQHSRDVYRQAIVNTVSLLTCKSSKQDTGTSHTSDDKGKVHHPGRTEKVKVQWKNPK